MTPQEIRAIRGDDSRKEFAAKIQYSHRTVEAWELGRKVPSPRAIKAIRRIV